MSGIISIVVLLSSLLFAVPGATNADSNHAGIRGTVTQVRPATSEEKARLLGVVMVEAEDKDAPVDKANLIITPETRILKQQDEKRVPADFDELKTGLLVEAQFVEGPTIMIYPLRVAAAEIVILNAREDAKE